MIRVETALPIPEHMKETIATLITSVCKEDVDIRIVKHRKKRSLDSNAYFHVLCEKLRQALNISFASCKNDLITSYGQMWLIEENPWIYKTNAPPEFIKEREEVHMKFIKAGDENTYFYRVYRGSHTYDTKEMALLIEGTVGECKVHGIETATPDELARMNAMWEKKYQKKQGDHNEGI